MRSCIPLLVVSTPVLAFLGCGGPVIASLEGKLVTGDWNGTSLSMTLDDRGGTTEYDCAHGGLVAPVVVDASGGFSVAGVHVRERGGPAREGEVPDSLPAVYVGRWTGNTMTVRTVVGTDTLGPFALRRDAPVRLFKCL